MIVSQDKSDSVMIASLSTISTPSSSTSSFEEAKCTTDSKLAEEQSIFHEASLAQAECDDDDDLEQDCDPSKKSYSNFEFMDEENQAEVADHLEGLSCVQKESPRAYRVEECLANEAKEYWATIDFYNNSKIAFNKRLKSVKSKRDKLNLEMKERQSGQLNGHRVTPDGADASQTDLCNCVKCSIIIHEALIQGLQNVHEILCKKCHSKLNSCKCILSRESCISQEKINLECNGDKSSSPSHLKNSLNKTELNHFEDKLFNIKNELAHYFTLNNLKVNLSETSLDVFQLLLQLSDTVLDLNNQLSSSTNVNQLFLLNSNSNLNQNLFSTFESKPSAQPEQPPKPTDSKSNKIENFLQKNFYSTQSEVNAANKHLNNSITSIINKINNRSSNQKIEQLKRVFSSKSRSNSSNVANNQASKLIENVYDKTSVTQFVDSLLNCKSGDDLSRASSGFYSASSLLTMVNQEDGTNASLSDTSHSYSIKQAPNIKLSSTTTNIIARQIKKPSSSNIDLSEAKSFRHSILSTSSSNTDSSIDHSKFMTIQSPRSKEMSQMDCASRKKSGSNNTLSSNSSCTSPVPAMVVGGARKPSFKFENNTILNKVQHMNIKSKYASPHNLNGICEGGSLDKRCSLIDRQSEYDSDRCLVKRQQSVKCQYLVQTPVRSESSLDSGINFSSENDESKTISGFK
ncbi:hypothetical protein BpHYR1_011939 [Brachionus plicatilis]|uniref:Uncharacterized protein n=1 Tax=Brachionus plicatilis TaxID=10195 RepID=A0A3M7T0N2_BRAPC|nr:hypothetical protein BpHYR1_011939 [Brachionus plicatilis]